MPSPNPKTIAEGIDACRNRLRSVSRTPWLDARLLAQYVTGLDASAVIAYGDAALDPRRRQRLFELTERRAAGEPVAYIIGRKAFCGLEIAVDRRALVPRPETEELVLACVNDWSGTAPAIAELGTGSGAIACALAHLMPDAKIVASDVSDEALELAAHNVRTLGFVDQVTLARSDLFEQYPDGLSFDVIIANLPYVGADSLDDLDPNVREHEPSQALLAGRDGLDAYRSLVAQAPARLRARGALYFECGPRNAEELRSLVAAAFPQARTQTCKDSGGLERMVICRSNGAT
ncbi:MAG TPA: peptide chain release factor N(5)-glutamine methyltransferase [Candidatus Eremiobacteraceae bacterium]|nr:peptide chain release factor N(5)-glutamine methyltransferase [Candidatus Eremiobacteraceae bacterium]